jgi:glycosyltransferase involved in cell wall biosynthesis
MGADAEVTVVVPTHNRCALLARTLATVLAQSDVRLRVVVVDEACSDGTPDFLDRLGDPRVEVVRNDVPLKLPNARNAGLERVRTPWVAFCDDDDLWAPDKLARQLDALRRRGTASWSAVGEVRFRHEDLRIVAGKHPPGPDLTLDTLLEVNLIPAGGSGVLAPTDLVRAVGGFRELPAAEDWDCWIRLRERAPLTPVDLPLVGYRVATGSHSHQLRAMANAHIAVLATNRARREANGAVKEHPELVRYRAHQAARAGDRRRAATLHLRSAVRYRRPVDAALAAAVTVVPRAVARWRDQRDLASIGSTWVADARRWLVPLLEDERADRLVPEANQHI